MKVASTFLTLLALLTLFMISIELSGCGAKEEKPEEREARWASGSFTSFELDNGIGPVTEEPVIGPLDPTLAAQGKAIFIQKCATCHYLDMRKTGPPLRDVTKRRTAAYVMNQVQNPEEMGKLHPEGQKLVAQYAQYMTIKGITPEMARQLLEFLRSEADQPAVPAEQQPGFGTPPPPATPDSAKNTESKR